MGLLLLGTSDIKINEALELNGGFPRRLALLRGFNFFSYQHRLPRVASEELTR